MDESLNLLDAVLTRLRQGHRLETHPCSLCGYRCAYVWSQARGLAYDPGCHCTTLRLLESRSEAYLAQHIAMNQARIVGWLTETPAS